MNLKDFQIEKIEELFSFTKDNYEQLNKTAYLKAPTGSGKTIILGNYIKKVISSDTLNNLCFVWASPTCGRLRIFVTCVAWCMVIADM